MQLGGGIAGEPFAQLLAEAKAARATGNLEIEEEALKRALDLKPGHLEANLLRARNLAQKGDRRAASAFYKVALRSANDLGAPPSLAPLLAAGTRYLEKSMQLYRQRLDAVANQHRSAGTRFQHCMEMLNGERSIYLQQPSVLYTPYLPQRQFYERDEFAWTAQLEARTDDIRVELQTLIDSGAPFRPYVEQDSSRPARDFFGMQGDPTWSALYLFKNGAVVSENAVRCPKTMNALAEVPLSDIGKRTPIVFFSLLRPGAHIPPHRGMLNCRLICHLPLIVPDGCWLRVGNETRKWDSGKLTIFDDSIEHEAKNGSDQLRVVLIFDIWRPELSTGEQAGISAVFDAIDEFTSLPAE